MKHVNRSPTEDAGGSELADTKLLPPPRRLTISGKKIRILYKQYLDLIKLEVEEFGVKPTEVRHLIGRLGEFYCAIEVNGSLAHTVNQAGFDVVADNGKRISVKTTAQKTGFIPISSTTVRNADDLMVIQYAQGELSTIYHGRMEAVLKVARYYKQVGRYNLDIAAARRLASDERAA